MSAFPKGPKKTSPLKKPPPRREAVPAAGGLFSRAKGATRRLSGLAPLDQCDIAFRPGELILVAGRSGHGKTNFLLNLLLNWLEEGRDERFLFYSLEMTPAQAAARLVSITAAKHLGVSMSSMQALKALKEAAPGGPVGAGWPQASPARAGSGRDPAGEALARLRRLEERLSFAYEPLWDVDRLAGDLVAKGSGPWGAVFVDAATSLLAPPGAARPERRDLELAHICRRLKEISVRLNCPVIGAAPTRPMRLEDGEGLRALIARGREFSDIEVQDAIRARRVRLAHLGEPSLEQEADMILGLLSYIADFHSEVEPDHRALFTQRSRGLLEVSAMKNRLGAMDSAELEMDSKTSWIRDNPELKSL